MAKRQAFTLIELLVVIGIIAVLIGILMPALTKARQQANSMSCLSNLHNMANAMSMYFIQNKNSFPFAQGAKDVQGGTTRSSTPSCFAEISACHIRDVLDIL